MAILDRRNLGASLFLATLGTALAACPPPEDVMNADASDVQTGTDASIDHAAPDVTSPDVIPADTAPTDASHDDVVSDTPTTPTCAANPTPVMITADTITADTTWDCDHTYILATSSPIFVLAPAVLTIAPGTVIRGDMPQAALIVTRGARLEAAGTREQPIVFTSNRTVGSRRSGDWGGVVLLGGASINDSANGTGVSGTNQIEGLDSSDMRGRYGGGTSPDDTWNCGTLRYARIEFAGYTLSANNELNGLTVAGCGSRTTLDYVQIHRGADDGVEFFGGTANLSHFVLTQSDDDGLDWDQGWRGKGQFIIVQGPAMSGESDPGGIEADNDRDVNTAAPISEPLLFNLSIIGPGNTVSVANMRGGVLRRGTAARIYNALFQGWPVGGVDVRDQATFDLANANPARLTIENSVFFANGPSASDHFSDNAPDSFDESAFFGDATRANRVDVDSLLAAPYSAATPDFVPAASSPLATGAKTPPSDAFFDATALYVGAIAPGASSNWTSGWTAYPVN